MLCNILREIGAHEGYDSDQFVGETIDFSMQRVVQLPVMIYRHIMC